MTALPLPQTTVATRGPDGRFLPGSSGRRPGIKNVGVVLNEAIKQAQKLRAELKEPCLCVMSQWLLAAPASRDAIYARSCRTLDQHYARRAFLDDTVLNAFQKKRIPDLIHQTGQLPPTQVNIVYGHTQPRVQVVEALHTNGA